MFIILTNLLDLFIVNTIKKKLNSNTKLSTNKLKLKEAITTTPPPTITITNITKLFENKKNFDKK